MHKTLLKVSICLLLVSFIIYACATYTQVAREIEKYNKLEKDAEKLLVNQADKNFTVNNLPGGNNPTVKKVYQFDFEKTGFHKTDIVTPPSDRSVGAGIMVELNKQKVLWGKNSHERVPIASLSKIMTVLIVLEEIDKRGDISLDTKIPISNTAKATPSSSFLRDYPLKEIPIRELLQSALVKSANDSCVLLSEYFTNGNPSKFAAMMNSRARMLQMKNTSFHNAHGLPTPDKPDNLSTMQDLVLLVVEIWETRKIMFKWSSERSLILPKGNSKGVQVNNTNPLIGMSGVIGLKTGYTGNAGWCLITVYRDENKVLVSIVTGCRDKTQRNSFCRALLLWGIKAAKTLN